MVPAATTQLGKAGAAAPARPLPRSWPAGATVPGRPRAPCRAPPHTVREVQARRTEWTGWKGGGGAGRALSPHDSQGGGGRASGQQSVSDWFRGLSTAPLHVGALQPPRATHHDRTGQDNESQSPRSPLCGKQGEVTSGELPRCLRVAHALRSVRRTAGVWVSHKHGHLHPCPNACTGTISRGG